MARKIPVAYKMTADTADAQKKFKGMEKVQQNTGKAGAAAGAAMAGGLAVALVGVAALKKGFDVLTGGLKFVWGLFKEGIGLASVQEQAMTSLTAAMNRAGESGRAAADDFAKFASAQQRLTGVGDEVTLAAGAIGASFGITGNQLKETTKAALDLAVGTGKGPGGLTNAMLLLGKAAKGDFGSLSRYGIVLDKNLAPSEKFEAALAAINKQFGGAAAEAAKTYQGRVDILGASFGDMKEELGFVFTKSELFNAVIGTVTNLVDTLGAKIKENRATLQDWIEKGWNVAFAVIDKVVQAGGFLAKGLIVLMEGWKVSKKLFDVLVIQPFVELVGLVKQFVNFVQPAISKGWEIVSDVFDALVIKPFRSMIELFNKIREKLGFDGIELPEWIANDKVFIGVGDAFAGLTGRLADGFNSVNDGTQATRDAIAGLKADTELAAEGIQVEYEGKIVPAIDKGTEAVKKQNKAWDDYSKVFGSVVAQVVLGQKTVGEGFKALIGSALDAMEKVVIAQAVEAAAKQGNSVMGIPPPVGPALAIAAATAAFALIKGLLSKAKFAEGGLVGDSGGVRRVIGGTPGIDSVPIVAQQGELVLPVSMVRQLSGLLGQTPGSRRIANSLPGGFAGGGLVSGGFAGFGGEMNVTITVEDSGQPLSSAQRRDLVNDIGDTISELARSGRLRRGRR